MISMLLSLVCWRLSLLDSTRDGSGICPGALNVSETLFVPCDSFFTMFWLLKLTKFDVLSLAGDFPSVDLLMGCEDRDDVIFGVSFLVMGGSLATAVVDSGVRVSIVAVRTGVLEVFCFLSRPLVLCLTTDGSERSWDPLGMLRKERIQMNSHCWL